MTETTVKNVVVLTANTMEVSRLTERRIVPQMSFRTFKRMLSYLRNQKDAEYVFINTHLLNNLPPAVAQTMVHIHTPAAIVIFLLQNRKEIETLPKYAMFIVMTK